MKKSFIGKRFSGWLFFLSLISCALLTACTGTSVSPEAEATPTAEATPEEEATAAPAEESQGELLVFAASSLTDAFTEIATEFEAQHPETTVVFNFGSSSQLAAQLAEGAPGHVFASANDKQMGTAVDANRITASPATFASNRLTLVVPADNPAGITSLEDLAKSGVQLVLAAEGVPIRQYTDEIITRLEPDTAAAIYSNVVSEEENVRQVLAKIALGEADAGLVYITDVTADVADQVQQITLPDEQNAIATYPIAAVADAPQPEQAQAFVDFVLSAEGQAILARWGFGAPTE